MEPMLAPGSSDLHILDPTGFEIAMLKSIVDKDAYLPTYVVVIVVIIGVVCLFICCFHYL